MGRTVITNVRIVDGTGAPAIENGVFIMQHVDDFGKDYISHVGEMKDFDKKSIQNDDNVLSLEGYTLLPGLFNVHAHLDLELPYLPYYVDKFGPAYRTLVSYRRAVEALNAGVTTVRNVGGADNFDIALRKAMEKNMLWGPRIVACGSPIIPHGGHGYTVPGSIQCSGEAEFIKAVRGQVAQGVDQIKLMFTGGLAGATEGIDDKQMTDSELAACIEIAHGANKKVSGHLSNDSAIRIAVELGLDSVEHAYTLTEETAELMAEKGAYLVPTLCVSNCKEYLKAHGAPDYTLDKLDTAIETHRNSAVNAIKAGVKICVGTDLLPSDPFCGTNATVREVELLVDAGMTPLQAIRAATLNSAELCDLDKITGSIEVGKEGDIIICKGKPDERIEDLRNIELVARGCRLVWSTLPDMIRRRFSVLPPGYEMEGGTFVTW